AWRRVSSGLRSPVVELRADRSTASRWWAGRTCNANATIGGATLRSVGRVDVRVPVPEAGVMMRGSTRMAIAGLPLLVSASMGVAADEEPTGMAVRRHAVRLDPGDSWNGLGEGTDRHRGRNAGRHPHASVARRGVRGRRLLRGALRSLELLRRRLWR